MKYNHLKIEKKWQKYWEKNRLYEAQDNSKKKKFYGLVEFPYPSGDGLHVGHVRSYTAMDIVCRKRRMQGFNVLYPMGWDAFGLPTENYAIKHKADPKLVTKKNTDTFRKQLKSLGLSFDWKREVNTTDPGYYKWTQWMFIKMWENGLAEKIKTLINWCPNCKIGLANEEVVEGKCDRCGKETGKKEKEQWVIKITQYADKLERGLDSLDFLEKIKIQQKNWIGRSEGSMLKFSVKNERNEKIEEIKVFTTRADTLFGVSFIALAPESESAKKIISFSKNKNELENYRKDSLKKSDLERISEEKEKTGVRVKGLTAENPANRNKIPVFLADYVLADYGSGAVMGVPAHDGRDFEFAKRYGLEIVPVIDPGDLLETSGGRLKVYEGEGRLINSASFSGLRSETAREKITIFAGGKQTINYKLRDWIFSRQRYWGEPIPMVWCQKCGWLPVKEKELPVKLPKIKDYAPLETGESPLAQAPQSWLKTKCPKCFGEAERETDTMPNWAGSSWYFLRYVDPKNKKTFADKKRTKYWLPIDWYNGGMEHTTLHLLYSRFWHRFLYDIKELNCPEPYQKRTSHGMILGENGEKMSKSRGNVVNPDDVIKEYGGDTLRLYEMFMGPFDQAISWNAGNILGIKRFLEKVWKISGGAVIASRFQTSSRLKYLVEKTIKKVSSDIEEMKFNTAVSALMICFNEIEKIFAPAEDEGEKISRKDLEKIIILLSPFAPHICEEIWNILGHKKSIFLEKWPKYDPKFIKEDEFELVIQINGKLKSRISAASGISQVEAEKLALRDEKIRQIIKDKKPKKIIYIQDKLLNIVV